MSEFISGVSISVNLTPASVLIVNSTPKMNSIFFNTNTRVNNGVSVNLDSIKVTNFRKGKKCNDIDIK